MKITQRMRDKLMEVRLISKPSPIFPSPYFIVAINGKGSTAVSMLSSYLGRISGSEGDEGVRKHVGRSLRNPPSNRREVRRFLRAAPTKRLLSAIKLPWLGAKTLLTLRKYRGFSDQSFALMGAVMRLRNEGIDASPIKDYVQEVGALEQKILKLGAGLGVPALTEFRVMPQSHVDYFNRVDSADPDASIKRLVAFGDLILLQCLYADLTRRRGYSLSEFEFIEKAGPGGYTSYLFDRLLSHSETTEDDNRMTWKSVLDKLGKDFNLQIDEGDFRAMRRGQYFIKEAVLQEILAVLGSGSFNQLPYIVAYCADWHYRSLGDEAQTLLNEVGIQKRLETAVERWDQLKLETCPDFPRPNV